MTKRIIDINSWERKAQYKFFSEYVQPMVGLCAKADITQLYRYCKQKETSVFLTYCYVACKAVNQIPELKTRIENEDVVQYDTINLSTTVLTENGSMLFCPLEYREDLSDFIHRAQEKILEVKKGEQLDDQAHVKNTLHCSTLPWLDFTMMEHPKRNYLVESVPKISFGKITHEDGNSAIPISIHVHHGLADGFHIAEFFSSFETIANQLND